MHVRVRERMRGVEEESGGVLGDEKQEGDEGATAEGRTSRMQPVSDNQRNDEEGGGWCVCVGGVIERSEQRVSPSPGWRC